MPNIFDQFDQKSQPSNVFDQFDEIQTQRQDQSQDTQQSVAPQTNAPQEMLQSVTGTLFGNDPRGAIRRGPLVRMDSGDFFEDETGELRAIATSDFIAQDPDSGQLAVFGRRPVEGPLDAARRVSSAVLTGMVAGAPTRLSGPGAGAAMSAKAARQADLAAAAERQGVDLTLPTLSESRAVKGMAATAREIPVASGIQERGIAREVGQVARRTEDVAGEISSAATREQAGASVREGLSRFRESAGREFNLRRVDDEQISQFIAQPSRKSSFSKKAAALYERVARAIPATAQAIPGKTQRVLSDIGSRFNNPALQEQFQNSFFGRLSKNIQGAQTWRDLRQLRSEIRGLKAEQLTVGEKTVNNAEIKLLEQALTEDILFLTKQAGRDADVRALRRADQFYRTGIKRLDTARKLLRVESDEALFEKIIDLASTKRTADIRKLNQVRRSIGEDEWSDVAAVTARRLGEPTAGAADTAIEGFSVGSFVTNYAKLSEKGKQTLLGVSKTALDDLAKIAASQKRTARFSAPTGGGKGVGRTAATAFIGTGVAAPFIGLDAFGIALSAIVGSALTAKFMTSPKLVRGLTRLIRIQRGPESTPRVVTELNRIRLIMQQDDQLAPFADQLIARIQAEGQGNAETRDGDQ